MTDDQQDPRLRDLVRAAAPSLVDNATAAILSDLGATNTIAALTGGFIGLAVALDQATGRRRAARIATMIEDAADDLGGPDILAQLALATDENAELTRRVLEAGARTTIPDKLHALSKVLANGLSTSHDGDTIDHALLLANALHDLEAPHVRVLDRIARHGNQPQPDPAPNTGSSGLTRDRLSIDMPDDRAVLEPVLAVLRLHGLISEWMPGTWASLEGQGRYVVSLLGAECLQLLGATDLPPVPSTAAPVDQ